MIGFGVRNIESLHSVAKELIIPVAASQNIVQLRYYLIFSPLRLLVH